MTEWQKQLAVCWCVKSSDFQIPANNIKNRLQIIGLEKVEMHRFKDLEIWKKVDFLFWNL
jgi:hypothetical protein